MSESRRRVVRGGRAGGGADRRRRARRAEARQDYAGQVRWVPTGPIHRGTYFERESSGDYPGECLKCVDKYACESRPEMRGSNTKSYGYDAKVTIGGKISKVGRRGRRRRELEMEHAGRLRQPLRRVPPK